MIELKYNHILFDLDGTLTDPREGITKAVRHALGQHGIIVNDLSELECFIGPRSRRPSPKSTVSARPRLGKPF